MTQTAIEQRLKELKREMSASAITRPDVDYMEVEESDSPFLKTIEAIIQDHIRLFKNHGTKPKPDASR